MFEFEDYKLYVLQWIEGKGSEKRGEFQRIAQALKVHPTLVSHIFRGEKNLSLEQASRLCRYLGLSQLETDYFLLLVQRAKSGSLELTQVFDRQIEELRKRSKTLAHRVTRDTILTDEDKATFYSNWYYSGIRLLTSIPKYQTKAAIEENFQLPMSLISDALEFLTRTGLCRYDGRHYSMGPALTHLESSSKWVSRHHVNWRLKAIEQQSQMTEEDLMFSGPLTLSKKDAAQFRETLLQLIQELGQLAKASKEEELRCFNLDWVKIYR